MTQPKPGDVYRTITLEQYVYDRPSLWGLVRNTYVRVGELFMIIELNVKDDYGLPDWTLILKESGFCYVRTHVTLKYSKMVVAKRQSTLMTNVEKT